MTKQEFIKRWKPSHMLIADLDAVIATEIEKTKVQPQPIELKGNCSTFDMSRLVDQVQPALNPIEQAFERGEKIRKKNWGNQSWYKKYDEKYVITNCGNVYAIFLIDFNSIKKEPEKWELYTEPNEQPAQPSSQGKLDNSFDKERFERMFRAVVASEAEIDFVFRRNETNYLLEQLDAYYATKNN